MATSGEVSLLSSIKWEEQPVALKEFASKHPIPNIVKVTKGQYRGAIGVAKSVHSELYLYSVSTGKKVLVESVKIKDGKATCSQQKYGIPLTYRGWFEVLSENGQAVKPLHTIPELVQSAHSSKNPNQIYLVRETLKGFSQGDDGELTLTSDIPVGEIIIVGKEAWVNQNVPKHGIVSRKCLTVKVKEKEDTVYVPYDTKCKLSPIAGQQNISGVHNVQALLDKFRLPIMVRLVHGLIPTKLEKRFTATFRLLRVYGDETVFFCPLKKDSKMVPISTREPLKIVPAENYDELKEWADIETLHQRCENMHSSYTNSIHVLFSLPEPERSLHAHGSNETPAGPKVEEDILFEEVEDIYMHVRQGGEPPPPRPRPMSVQQPPPIPKKESKQPSILGAFAMKFMRRKEPFMKSQTNHAVVPASSPTTAGPVTPTSAVSTAVDYGTPPPLPDKKGPKIKDNSFDYWEEPIYEPLEKIRNMKKNKQKDTVIQMSSSPPKLLSDDSIEPIDNPLVALASSDGDIKTLREVYKHTTYDSNNSVDSNKDNKATRSSKKSNSAVHIPQPDYDLDVEPPAPPVPPKHFDMNELEETMKTTTAIQRNLSQPIISKTTVIERIISQPILSTKNVLSSVNDRKPKIIVSTPPVTSSVQTTVNNPLFTKAVAHTSIASQTKPASAKPAIAKVTTSTQSTHVNTSTQSPFALLRKTSPNSSKPYLIRNVTPSNRRTKGTTVHIDGDSTTRISTPPLPPQISSSGTSTSTPPGVASKMSYVQSPPPNSHPPFVAVARVGENYDHGGGQYNNGAVVHRVSVDQNRRKLQSMYL